MKKIIAMLLALLFVTALAACGSKTAETAPAATQAPAAEQKQETYTSSQGTVDGYDPNQKSDFPMNTSEEVHIFNIGEVDASLFEAPVLVTSFGASVAAGAAAGAGASAVLLPQAARATTNRVAKRMAMSFFMVFFPLFLMFSFR